MVKSPRISAVLQKDYPGYVVVSLNGKVLGVGKDSVKALRDAIKIMPDIEDKDFWLNGLQQIEKDIEELEIEGKQLGYL